jgi:gas vesicle protein
MNIRRYKMSERNGFGDRFKYFMIGGITGVLATLLLAPRSGMETREFLANKAQEGKEAIEEGIKRGEEKVVERGEMLVSEARDLVDKAKNISSREKEIILAAIDAGRKAYNEEKQSLSR